ncbi:methyl-accepting chemotaxis protein [Pseudothermotoga sp.]
MSLKVKVALLVVVFLVLGVSTVTITNLLALRGKLLAYAEGEMLQKVEKEAFKLDNWFRERFITLQGIAPNLENLFLFFDVNMIDMSLRSYAEGLQKLGFVGQILMSLDGRTFALDVQPEKDLSKERFFQEALNGKIFVQDNVVFKNTKGLLFSVPVMSYSQEIVGVYAAFLPQQNMDELVLNVKHGQRGYAFLTNGDAVVISHPDVNVTGKRLSQVDQSLKIVEDKVMKREIGAVNYTFQSEKKMAAVASVPSVGWSIALTIPRKEIEAVFRETIVMSLSVAAAVAVVAAIVAVLFGRSMTKPITMLSAVSQKIAEGDLSQMIEFKRSSGETSLLSSAFSTLTNSLKDSIMNIKKMQEKMSSLSEQIRKDTESAKSVSQEAKAVSEDVNKIITSVGQLVHQVNMGAKEVASGSEQTSKSALLLSENSEKMRKSSKAVQQAVKKLVDSVEAMTRQQQSVSKSIQKLADLTGKIEEVITTIYSVAEQTNLLALNAAIEAARAGEAGRGFAVVAEEIRKLAEQSRFSTKQIGDFLAGIKSHAQLMLEQEEEIAKRNEESNKAISESLKTLEGMMEDIEKVASMSNDLAAISQEQTAAVEEINAAIERIVKEIDKVSSSIDTLSKGVTDQAERVEGLSQSLEEVMKLFEDLTTTFAKYKV